MGRTYWEKISLDEVVSESKLIVVGNFVEESTRDYRYNNQGFTLAENERDCYMKGPDPKKKSNVIVHVQSRRFRVEKELVGKLPSSITDNTIEVLMEYNYDEQLNLSIKYYFKNLRKSPVYYKYEPTSHDGKLILFLQPSKMRFKMKIINGSAFKVCYKQAYESAGKIDEVMEAIKKK